jgi:hypothetical protein
MQNKSKLGLVLMTLTLLLVMALGPMSTGLAGRVAEPMVGEVEVWDGLHGLLAPHAGGGGGT